MREVVAELMKFWPDATNVELGSHSVYRHHDETPAHKFDAIIKMLPGPRLIELTARDGFDARLATFLLDSVDEAKLPALDATKIRVFAAEFPSPWPFECVVVVPPKIAERFEHESPLLKQITYWVVPAFAGEFRDSEAVEGFWHQLRRRDGWKVSVIQWERSRKLAPAWD